jgi:hypothetical protein
MIKVENFFFLVYFIFKKGFENTKKNNFLKK